MKKILFSLMSFVIMFTFIACSNTFEYGEVQVIDSITREEVNQIDLQVEDEMEYEVQVPQGVTITEVLASASSDCVNVQTAGSVIMIAAINSGTCDITLQITAEGYESYTIVMPVKVVLREQVIHSEIIFANNDVMTIDEFQTITLEDISNSDLHESTKFILEKRLENNEVLFMTDLVESDLITKFSEDGILVTVGQSVTFQLPVLEDTTISVSTEDSELFELMQGEDDYTITPLSVGSGILYMTFEREHYKNYTVELRVFVREPSPQIYFYNSDFQVEIGQTLPLDYIVFPENAEVIIQSIDQNFMTEWVEEALYISGTEIATGTLMFTVSAEDYLITNYMKSITVTPTKSQLEIEDTSVNLTLLEDKTISVKRSDAAITTLTYDETKLSIIDQGQSLKITPLSEGDFDITILVQEENYYDNEIVLTVSVTKGPVDLKVSDTSVIANELSPTTVTISSSTENAMMNITATEGVSAVQNGNTLTITATKDGTVTVEAVEANHKTTTKTIQVTYLMPTISLNLSNTSVSISSSDTSYIVVSADIGASITLSTTGGVSAYYDELNTSIVITASSSGTIQVTATKSGYQTASKSIQVTFKETYSISSTVEEVIALVNEERAKVGLGALTYSQVLTDGANIRAQEIVTSFSHTRPDGSTCFTVTEGVYGENIAYGYKTAADVMTGWMNSQGHKENILRDYFNTIGIGIYQSGNTIYWVQLFGI